MVTNGLDNSSNYLDAWKSYVLINEEKKKLEEQPFVYRSDDEENKTYINW